MTALASMAAQLWITACIRLVHQLPAASDLVVCAPGVDTHCMCDLNGVM